ncbi:hypothetical protein BXY66_3007 [Shimia isoporae]|uniref:Small ligand-binding sensory domain FIST n=1 Tax=Shimia isoporae TaxID=647720 RepID=A0A4R1NAF2_9RHOB|nr:FIST N-terminal domain-containing protein [Shimia isoporae]TCL00366.1 hypothetical protein BXY66_3007 [Shimia isoporae]
MLKVATGSSEETDSVEAFEEAYEIAMEDLGGMQPKAALVFAGIDLDLSVVADELRKQQPDIVIAGCTTDGEVATPEGFLEDSLVITLFASDDVSISVGMGANASSAPEQATADAVAMAKAATSGTPALCIAMPEGIGTNINSIVEGLRDALGQDFPIVGGAAGDQLRFQGTHQLCNDQMVSDAVVVMLLSGDITVSCGVSTGYTPLGSVHKVTKSEGSVIQEIDGRPAVDLYKDYVQAQSIFFPLAVHVPGREGFLLSSPQHFDEETGAIHFVNPVAADREVQIATASRDEIVSASRAAVQQAFDSFPDDLVPDAALVFSCAGRRAALGTRTGEEYESFEDIIGGAFPTAGFYTYGEISPVGKSGKSLPHTNAFVAVLLGSPSAS